MVASENFCEIFLKIKVFFRPFSGHFSDLIYGGNEGDFGFFISDERFVKTNGNLLLKIPLAIGCGKNWRVGKQSESTFFMDLAGLRMDDFCSIGATIRTHLF